jgi:hypothetical protein
MVLVVAMGCCFVKLLQRPNKVSGGWQALNVLLLKKRGMKQVIQPVSAIGKLGPLDVQWFSRLRHHQTGDAHARRTPEASGAY